MPNTPEIRPVVISTQQRSETQLHTARGADTCPRKRWVSLGFWSMWRVWRKLCFSMIWTVLVASVQPNLQCHEQFFLKLTPMVALPLNPTYVHICILFSNPRLIIKLTFSNRKGYFYLLINYW